MIINSECKNCKQIFQQKNKLEKYLKKFCSRSCSAQHNNPLKTILKTKLCQHCGNSFVLNHGKYKNIFCSTICSGKHRLLTSDNSIEKVKAGLITHSPTLKRILAEKYGYKCNNCSISNWLEKAISLHLDHIDGNSDNNILENLRLLCPNCHSQTETFSGRNVKNSKRSAYNQRYRIKKLVGDKGIEPLKPECKSGALPLS